MIPSLGSGRYSPGPNIGLSSWLKGEDPNYTINVCWGQPGILAIVSFSVQYHPGKTIQELAAAGRFRNAQISVTTAEVLIAAGAVVGYTVGIIQSPGAGYHHTVQVPCPFSWDVAVALSAVFTQMPNPARVLDL